MDYSKYLIHSIPVASATRLYQKQEKRSVEGVLDINNSWSLYSIKTELDGNPIIVLDERNFIRRRQDRISLVPLSKAKTLKHLEQLPSDIRRTIGSLREKWGENDQSSVFYAPKPALRRLSDLEQIDWNLFLEDLLAHNRSDPDPRIMLIRGCTVLKGLRQATNGHSIICTPGNTGKSEYYEHAGDRVDRLTATNYIGFSRSPTESYPGTVHESEVPQALDQLENQQGYSLYRYVFQLMESGKARVQTGATSFNIWSKSTFIVLANPIGYTTDSTKSFISLMEHMTKNPTLGRRFGLLLYSNNVKVLKNKASEEDISEWISSFEFLRAVEESCRNRIQEVYNNPIVWNWCNDRIDGYYEDAASVISPIKDEGLRDFLKEFSSNGTTHTRGAALSYAILRNLKDIALGRTSINKILHDAEIILPEIIEMNLESIYNITKSQREALMATHKMIFGSFPIYLKTIIAAVELYRESALECPKEIHVSTLDFSPNEEMTNFSYFSQALHLARRSNPLRYNPKLERHFRLRLREDEGSIVCEFLSKNITEGIQARKYGVFRGADEPSNSNILDNLTEELPIEVKK